MGKGVEYDIPVRRYQGPKTVLMPEKCSKKNVLPLKVLCSALIAEKRAKELDTAFLLDITQEESSCLRKSKLVPFQLSQMIQTFSCSLFIFIQTKVLPAPCS